MYMYMYDMIQHNDVITAAASCHVTVMWSTVYINIAELRRKVSYSLFFRPVVS